MGVSSACALLASLCSLLVGGCFIEASAGAYSVTTSEATATTSTGVGIAFGAYWDTGSHRVALGVGGDVTEVEGFEDSSGSGSVAYGVGPYYLRGDTALKSLTDYLSLDLTAVLLAGTGPAAVIYETNDICTASCSENVSIKDGKVTVGHAGPSVGGFLGPSIALHNQGPGELRVSLGLSVMHSRVASRDPFTAYGPQVRIVYGFTRFGSKDARISGLFDGYSNSLDSDIQDHNRSQGERDKRRRDDKIRQDKEKERDKR